MKTAEPLLYTINVIWVVEDLFWLAIAVSFDYYSLAHALKGSPGALVQCAVSGLRYRMEYKLKIKYINR